MSVTTYSNLHTEGMGARFKSALKSIFASMIAAREAEAHRLVAAHLAMHAAATGKQRGANRKDAVKAAKLAYTR